MEAPAGVHVYIITYAAIRNDSKNKENGIRQRTWIPKRAILPSPVVGLITPNMVEDNQGMCYEGKTVERAMKEDFPTAAGEITPEDESGGLDQIRRQ